MSRYYTYVSYEDIGQSNGPNFENNEQSNANRVFPNTFSTWLNIGEKMFRALPWLGAAAIALGILVIAFPMLLVMAVAGLFFAAGVVCLGLWWRLRNSNGQPFSNGSAWDKFEGWF